MGVSAELRWNLSLERRAFVPYGGVVGVSWSEILVPFKCLQLLVQANSNLWVELYLLKLVRGATLDEVMWRSKHESDEVKARKGGSRLIMSEVVPLPVYLVRGLVWVGIVHTATGTRQRWFLYLLYITVSGESA